MGASTHAPRACAYGGRLWVRWLPLIAIGVVLCILTGPGGILAQAQVAPPTIDAVTPGDGALALAWTSPAGVTGITAYDLRHIQSDAADKADANWTEVQDVWTTGAGALTYTLAGLQNAVGYDVQLRTVTTTDGAWSATSTGTPQIPGPVLTAVTTGDGALTVAWSAPAVAAATRVTAYDVRSIASAAADKADGNWTVAEDFWTAGSLEGVLAGLTNGTAYDVQVRAVAATDGAWSATATGTPADHGATLATATTLTLGAPVHGTIDTGTDVDSFKIELTAATGIIVSTRGALDTVGQLLDANEVLLRENDEGDELHGRHNFLLWGSLQAGTYYVTVTGGDGATGAYVLRTTTVTDTTARSDAQEVAVGGFARGIIDPETTDSDWFRITVTGHTVLLIHSTGLAVTWGDLWQSGNLMVPNTEEFPLGSSPRFGFFVRVNLSPGTYYVEVGGSRDAIGAYTLHVDRAAEPGSSTAAAQPLVPLFPKAGTISPADDADYFRIELARATHVILSAVGSAVPIAGELLDADGNPVDANIREARWTASGPAGFQLRDRLGAGTHYLKVTRLAGGAGSSTGRYGLRMYEDYVYGAFIDGCTALTASLSDPLSDPLSGCQWHLENTGQLGGTPGEDINVREVWAAGHLGAGATVALVDNGLDVEHPDLAPNVLAERNYAYGGATVFNPGNTHGTGAAGLIAARDNDIGVRGIAPRAQIYGYNIIDAYNPTHAADAMTRGMETTAISNNSWSVTEGPGYAAAPSGWERAVVRGVTEGYGGKGVLYVRSGGNDAVLGANSNLSGFRNHYTATTACAVTDHGVRSHYSEKGANLWVCAPSGASYLPAAITTTANYGHYRNNYGGTSSTAAIVSGVAALLRGAYPDLTWRDVKLILAGSARKNDSTNAGWEEGALEYGSTTQKYHFNHEYGFGVVDAKAAMGLAAGWTSLPPLPPLTEESQASGAVDLAVPDRQVDPGAPTTVTASITMGYQVQFTEFVEIHVDLTAAAFRDLEIELVSPSGTVSVLSPYFLVGPGECRSLFGILPGKCNLDGPVRFGSAKHLGEDPAGDWTLRITDYVHGGAAVTLNAWSLKVYGHRESPAAPAIDTVAAGGESLAVTWTAPADTGTSAITAYDLRTILTSADETVEASWTLVEDAWTTGSGDRSYVVTGLTGNAEYDVQVRAVNASGDGLWSDTATGTPTTDKAPTIDAVTPGDQSIAIAWTAPINATLGTVTAYDLRHVRSDASSKADTSWTVLSSIWTTGSLAYTLNPTATSLVNGVSYDVQVRAVVGTDPYPWSGVRAATPRTIPDAPTVDAVTGADGVLTVAWSAPANNGGDAITSYDLRSIKTADDETDDTNWAVQPGVWSIGNLTAPVTGLDTGTRYDVEVRAVNGAGAGAWSATSVGTTRPGAPAVDAVTGVVGGLTVGWSAPATDGDAPVTSYDLRTITTTADAAVEGNWRVETGVWSAGDLTATVTGLALGTQYDVQVRAVNAAGTGPWSATLAGTTLLSDDAALTGLTLSGVRLAPGFTSGVTAYAGAVGYTVTSATVAATRSDANAAVVVLDGNGNTLASAGTAAVDLSVGATIVRVRVTAQDGVATMTYTVTVTRTEADPSLTPRAGDPAAPFASTAVYTVTFQGAWTTAATPDRVPGGAHFSRLIGAVHSAGVTFLESGGTASPGVESMAEVGGTSALRRAVADAGSEALSVIQGGTNSIGPTTTKTLTVTLSTDHRRVTLVTMVAPSPDWFVGVSGLTLLNTLGDWMDSLQVDLYPWDAGTEDGGGFSLSNPATSPRGVITSIRGTGKFTTERIASLTFTLESVNYAPTGAPFITGVAGAPEVGEELTAHTSTIDDRNGLASPGYAYQWLRVDSGGQAAPISGATSADYTVQAVDVGRQLRVRVSFTDDESNRETLTSDATDAVILTQVTVSFGAGGYAAEEGGKQATVRVMLDKAPHRTLRIPLHAATGGGAASADYAAPAQVTFRPGETAKDAQVTAADDLVDDDGESVTLSFGDLPDGVFAGSPSETVVELIDDDFVPVTLGWEETAFTAEEPTSPGATTAVTLRAAAVTATDKRPESGFTLAFTVRTANGTARQPDDYEEFTATETLAPSDFTRTPVGSGQFRYVASADFIVTVLHDTVDEPLERFTVWLALASAGQPHLSLGDATATVTTTDDVASLADLRTTVFATPSAVEPSGEVTYAWSVHNSGPAAATSTVITTTLDGGVTFVSAQVSDPATGQCRQSGRTVTCTVGTLEAGDTASGEVVVRVKGNASADVGFTAVATADQLDRTPADNDALVATALVAPPRQITDLRAVGERRHIDLTWSPPGDNGSGVTGYELERKAGTDDFLPVFPQPQQGTTSYRDEGISEDTEYTYRLRALNEDGEGAWSNEPVATLLAPPPSVSSGGGSSGGGSGGGFGPAPVAPGFADGFRTARDVAQNARPGDAVGDPVAATHPNDLEITYSLSGADAASFTVDAKTGQIRVKEGVALEAGRTYTVNLTATDSAGFGAIIIVTVAVAEATHHPYDANRNGAIERDEVVAAVRDYFDGEMTKEEVIELIKLYFAG